MLLIANRLRESFSQNAGSKRAVELDAIRGLAIMLAVGSHLNRPSGNALLDWIQTPAMRWGAIGVDIFFVLSGFLIGGMIIREIDTTGGFNIKKFLTRRAFRLWPVLYLFVVAHMLFKRSDPYSDYVPQIFFHVQNYFRTPINHLWSLAVEEQFYLLAALLLPLIARLQINTRPMLMWLAGLAAFSSLLRTVAWYYGVDAVSLQWQTQYRIDVLLVGIILAVLKFRRHDLYIRLQGRHWPYLLVALACCFGLNEVSFHPTYVNVYGRWLGMGLGASLILGLDGVQLPRPALWIARPLAFLGIYSYSIYIWHPGIGRSLISWAAAKSGSLPLGILIGNALVVALGVAITRSVERPMMALRDRLFPSNVHS